MQLQPCDQRSIVCFSIDKHLRLSIVLDGGFLQLLGDVGLCVLLLLELGLCGYDAAVHTLVLLSRLAMCVFAAVVSFVASFRLELVNFLLGFGDVLYRD